MELSVCTGPMDGGKSTFLYDTYFKENKLGNVKVVCHTLNHNYSNGFMNTHSGLSIPADLCSNLLDIPMEGITCLLIDEAQWFTDLIEFIDKYWHSEIKVYVAGLISDKNQQKFGNIQDIMHKASSITFVRGKCSYCNNKSSFTTCLLESKERDIPGGLDTYKPVCRQHIYPPSK